MVQVAAIVVNVALVAIAVDTVTGEIPFVVPDVSFVLGDVSGVVVFLVRRTSPGLSGAGALWAKTHIEASSRKLRLSRLRRMVQSP